MAAVVMLDFMAVLVVARCLMMMSPGRVMFWRGRAFHRLMSWGGFRRAPSTTVRSCHHGSAESYTGKDEKHKFFESLVHITPSLSLFGFMRTIFAAYKKEGERSSSF